MNKLLRNILVGGFAVGMTAGCAAMEQNSTKDFWPQGKTYAVSLTYDDGLQSQMDIALPQLSRAGLRGTFFFTGTRGKNWDQSEIDSLKKAKQELAAHTLKHPCDRNFDWVAKGDGLQDYSDARMEQELDENLGNLVANGVPVSAVSFAYPCGQTYVGEDKHSYIPLVKARFIAARGVYEQLATPGQIDLYKVNAIHGDTGNAVAWIDKAQAQKAWAVFMFHGVGGDYLEISAKDHQALLERIKNDKQAWVAPFGEIVTWVKKKQGGEQH